MQKRMKETDSSLFPRNQEVDISTEVYRLYRFPKGDTVLIKNPQTLVVTDNGHRVIDAKGQSHYVPYGWIHLKWKTKEGEKPFYYQRDNEDKKNLLVEKK